MAFDLGSALDSDDEGDLDMVENNGNPITGVEQACWCDWYIR